MTFDDMLTTQSGLKMRKVFDGEGEKPVVGQTVSAHYEICFSKGTTTSNYDYESEEYVDEICDDTYEDKPFSGPVDFVIGQETAKDDIYKKGDSIKGFDEAFLDMQIGEKRKLVVPPELAYGEEGASSFHTFFGYRVPPNTGIRCALELVEIKN